jgi:hypothetical protein
MPAGQAVTYQGRRGEFHMKDGKKVFVPYKDQ